MSELYELLEHPTLDAPVLVLALDGWIDAGFGAARARDALLQLLEPVTVATFDGDRLLDHRARRPTMHLANGVLTGLTWPSVELRAATDTDGNDLLLLTGAEPDHEWRAFVDAVVDLALQFGVRTVVGLGAYPAPVPHTRSARLAVAASDPALASAGSERTTIDVPAGIQAAIERASFEHGIPAVGLWAQVPHYVATMGYPAASLALVEGLSSVTGLRFDTSALRRDVDETRERLDSLVAANDDHQRMVQQLEIALDGQPDASPSIDFGGELPSGDELAEEVERFLRDQGNS